MVQKLLLSVAIVTVPGWRHLGQMVSMDFFTVPTVSLRVMFVFVVLEHRRRQVLHCNREWPCSAARK